MQLKGELSYYVEVCAAKKIFVTSVKDIVKKLIQENSNLIFSENNFWSNFIYLLVEFRIIRVLYL